MEHYIRPPIVATEPLSAWAAVWRFRLLLGVAFVAFAAALVLLVLTFANPNGERNPGVGRAGTAASSTSPGAG